MAKHHRPRITQVIIDAVLIAAALSLAFLVRFGFEGEIPARYVRLLLWSLAPVVIFKLGMFAATGVYAKWWRYATIREVVALLRGTAIASLGLAVLAYLVLPLKIRAVPVYLLQYPRSVLVIDWLLSMLLLGGVRFGWRMVSERPVRSVLAAGTPVLVVGAGDAGDLIVREMLKNPEESGYTAVGFLDDDAKKKNMRMHGLKVLGTTHNDDIRAVLDEYPVEEAIVAMPSVAKDRIRGIVFRLEAEGVRCKIVPGVYQMLKGHLSVASLRDVEVEDILGREPITVDLAAISGYVAGRNVLVTGAGGSIGSELCRQLCDANPAMLIMIDNAESNLFAIEQEILRDRDFPNIAPLVGDIKNRQKMRRLFAQHMPDVVFHAAAYKHVPLMEVNPAEAVFNNVVGTTVLAEEAARSGVDRFVMISTDKAVEPATVMGATKAVAERIVASMGKQAGTRFFIVRFGNVLDSSGSVVPIFKRQIGRGGPVTVTHPDMTRYFMTIGEAVSLVIQAGAMGQGGEIFVLDMGEPIKIVDLAENMIRLSGLEPEHDIEVEFIGVRPGEKLTEELFGGDEEMMPTTHSKIRLARHAEFDVEVLNRGIERLEKAATAGGAEAIVAELRAILPDYQPRADRLGNAPQSVSASGA